VHRHRVPPKEFDADPFLLNCATAQSICGTGELRRPFARADSF